MLPRGAVGVIDKDCIYWFDVSIAIHHRNLDHNAKDVCICKK